MKATWFKQSCAEDRSAVHAGLKVMARRKYYFEDEETAFSLVEEHSFYRLRVERSAIEDKHVEEFLDRTVEWLSRNPDKGILIDFKGVKSVCNEFAIHLSTLLPARKRQRSPSALRQCRPGHRALYKTGEHFSSARRAFR